MIDLRLPLSLAADYHSPSQKIRIITEHRVAQNANCPACAKTIEKVSNNRPGLDFVCSPCGIPFELKSKRGTFGTRIIDGAYATMIDKVMHDAHSNFFLLNYDNDHTVTNLVLVPKRFIVPEIIEKRKPLSSGARRSGWVGCNLRISLLPDAGRISYIRHRSVVPLEAVLGEWRRTGFLDGVSTSARGWLVAVMNCVERINKNEFTLRDMYECVPYLQSLFPNNRNVEAKVRQQLQVLRDKGWLTFLGSGKYKKNTDPSH